MATRYAINADLDTFGLAPGTLSGLDTPTREATLDARSSYADGFLCKRFTLPLSAWGDDLRQAVVHLATWDLLCRRGFRPDAAGDVAVDMRREQADRWLHDVARGLVEPQGVVDATPAVTQTFGVRVASQPRRGW